MKQDKFVFAYYRLVGNSWLYKLLRFLVRHVAYYHLKFVFKFNTDLFACTNREGDVIVSLTSFPTRINNLWLVIETLLRQTVRPRVIYVWLSKDQFSDYGLVPESLRRMRKRGVEIRMVDGDIRSHKKYYYVFQEHPKDLILLADDDIFYPSDLIESLVSAREVCKTDKIVSHKYGYRMRRNHDGSLAPYNSWGAFYSAYEGDDLFFGSGGGTLVRPKDFFQDTLNLDLALQLCPTADDIWLNAMAKLGGCHFIKVKDGPILPVLCKNDKPLYKQNMGNKQNDIQINAVYSYYKDKMVSLTSNLTV